LERDIVSTSAGEPSEAEENHNNCSGKKALVKMGDGDKDHKASWILEVEAPPFVVKQSRSCLPAFLNIHTCIQSCSYDC